MVLTFIYRLLEPSNQQAVEIITSGVVGYHRRKERLGKVHREGWETSEQRELNKLIGKSTWFKKSRNLDTKRKQLTKKKPQAKKMRQKPKPEQPKKTPASIIFVKRTPGGKLATDLKQVERDLSKTLNQHVKVIERNGIQLQRLVTKVDPWAGGHCGREACTVCKLGYPKGQGAGRPT